jgi:DNA-binding transcriptional ArsR family regulator
LRRFAPLCKALGDETRLTILELLARRRGDLCVCEIDAHFDLSQPTISHHLKLLREAGLVRCERRGPWAYYSLDHAAVEALESLCVSLKRQP